jgi:hypothetical protein
VIGLFLAFLFLSTGHAQAQETSTYSYDAKGRLIGYVKSGGPNNGQTETLSYDAADNRTNLTVTGTPSTTVSTISITAASTNEGTSLAFTITRVGNTTQAVSASWATSNGAAIAGTNYSASSGTVSFAVGVTTATVSVPTSADGAITPNLTLTVTLSAPSNGAALGTASATGTIIEASRVFRRRFYLSHATISRFSMAA